MDPDIRYEGFGPWLEQHARVSIQNPWWVAAKDPTMHTAVYDIAGQPVTLYTTIDSDGGTRPYLIRPDLLIDLDQVLDTLGLDDLTVGFQFCKEGHVPERFAHLHPTIRKYEQLVQEAKDFHPDLEREEDRHLRQNIARAKRQGLTCELPLTYDPEEISDLTLRWVGEKRFGGMGMNDTARALKVAASIDAVANNPYGKLYGARDKDGNLHAVTAALRMDGFVSIEHVINTRGPDRAQEYLDVELWRHFNEEGVKLISRGNKAKHTTGMILYKSKYGTLRTKTWLNMQPALVGRRIPTPNGI